MSEKNVEGVEGLVWSDENLLKMGAKLQTRENGTARVQMGNQVYEGVYSSREGFKITEAYRIGETE